MTAAWLRLLRPAHWIKNLFVLGPLLFSGRAFDPLAVTHALQAFAAFCLVSSGVYAINDVMDRDADRVHPIKRLFATRGGTLHDWKEDSSGCCIVCHAAGTRTSRCPDSATAAETSGPIRSVSSATCAGDIRMDGRGDDGVSHRTARKLTGSGAA